MRPDELYRHTLCCLYTDVLKLCNRKPNSSYGSCYSQETEQTADPDKTRQRMFPDFPEFLLKSESQKA
jgi:hypothetical protein